MFFLQWVTKCQRCVGYHHPASYWSLHWNCSANMCFLCDAGDGDNATHPWRDFRRCASWRSTKRDHCAYLRHLEEQGKILPEVFLIRGFRLEGVVIDTMHCADLGITMHILGNIFWEIACSKKLASTQAASVALLWESIKA